MAERPTRKILIVDDNFDMRMILRITLERTGWLVVDAKNGIEAIEKARSENPQVIVMDYNMPEMDGVTACRQISELPEFANVPILVYTGAYTEQVQTAALEAGAMDFMSKPLLPAELRKKVEAAYAKYQSATSD